MAKQKADREKKEKLQEYLEEYYKLDYEDLIAGEIPTRFNYTKVQPGTFGLSLNEILEEDDQELNRKVSLKKLAPYRTNQYNDRDNQGNKRYRENWKPNKNFQNPKKQKIEKPQQQTEPSDPNKKSTIKERKKRMKMKKKLAIQGVLPSNKELNKGEE